MSNEDVFVRQVRAEVGLGWSEHSTRTPEQYADRVGQRCQPKPIPSASESLMT